MNPSVPDAPPLAALPPKLAARVNAELRPDERVVWAGQPDPDRPAVLFGCLNAAGFALAALSVVPTAILFVIAGQGHGGLRHAWPIVALGPMIGGPFLFVGILLLAIRRWIRLTALGTCYVLTDCRALVMEPRAFGGHSVRTYGGAALRGMAREERADGSGSLVFEKYIVRDRDGMGTKHPRGFLDIDDVRFVEEIVRRTLVDRPG